MEEALTLSVEDLNFLSDKIKNIYLHREKHKVKITKVKEGVFDINPVIPVVCKPDWINN